MIINVIIITAKTITMEQKHPQNSSKYNTDNDDLNNTNNIPDNDNKY